jgi:hypothetical protein
MFDPRKSSVVSLRCILGLKSVTMSYDQPFRTSPACLPSEEISINPRGSKRICANCMSRSEGL